MKTDSRVVIVGYGRVGMGMHSIFPDATIVDIDRPLKSIGQFDLTIVCVPTPQNEDGSCDTFIVEDVVRRAQTDLVLIKSTVTPGTALRLQALTGKKVVFSPEYMGESSYWTPAQYPNPSQPLTHGFMILGGDAANCSQVADIFMPRLGPATRFRFMTSTEAEIVKYAENAFFALKVTFANDLRTICELAGVNYHTVREGWLDDPRVGPMHTAAFKNDRGFGGKCFPKDVAALVAYTESHLNFESKLLRAVMERNKELVK